MSIKSGSSGTSSISCTFADIPEKLKKAISDCSNSNEVLDSLLKTLGDTSNDPQLAISIIDLIQTTCSEPSIQCSELEFAILSLQNIFNANQFKVEIQCQILIVMVTVLLTRQSSSELTSDVVGFLLQTLENQIESPTIWQTSLDCLIEIELHIPGFLVQHLHSFVHIMNSDDILSEKAAELVGVIIKHSQYEQEFVGHVNTLLEILPCMNPLTMASVYKDVFKGPPIDSLSKNQLESTERVLLERYKSTFDLCILRTVTSIQELSNGITENNMVVVSSTHPALPVARNLIALDWIASGRLREDSFGDPEFYCGFQPTPFDGADARLKKVAVLNKLLKNHPRGSTLFSYHLEQLMDFAHKAATSRSQAAVFRALYNMLQVGFPTNALQLAVDTSVAMASRNPGCLPHVVDFLKYSSPSERLSRFVILKLVDAFDEMEAPSLEPYVEHLVAFFVEASTQPYEFCQPRLILHTILHCAEEKECRISRSSQTGVAVLELCQNLIRNQEANEIFHPELRALLSLLEASHEDTDVKQRAWMLRSLITHVNTDCLKDAFNVDMDLSTIGRVEETDRPLVSIKVLFDSRPSETYSINWSLDRKRSSRSIYFPLEITLAPSVKNRYSEYIGIRIDFALDVKCGHADAIYIPMLTVGQVKKACLHLDLEVCSSISVGARAVMSTTDGRIFSSALEDIHFELEHILSPIASSQSLSELWDSITSRSEKCCSTTMTLARPEKLLAATECGSLRPFQLTDKKTTELALVSPDSLLILMRIFPVTDSWHAEILVEEVSLLSVVYSLLSDYSC